jgi:hypothetical protein
VLGHGVLDEIASDRAGMQLPSWINPAPARAGHKSHGKLSADQWRTFCSINLTTTLVRLWGSQPADSRKFKMLSNFIDLVVAVELASSLVIAESDIERYDFYLRRYLEEMKELYRDVTVTPNHHDALHVSDFLRALGPSPWYRAFHVERFNYILQQINTNGHVGSFDPPSKSRL